MQSIIISLIGAIAVVSGLFYFNEPVLGAPTTGANYVANTLKLPNLLSKNCLGTDGSGLVQEGTCTGGGGGGGSGSVSTSSPGVVSSLLYYTTAGATPELVDPVATTTLTASSPLSLSNPVAKVGGSNSILTLDTSGTWSGNAGTASALAANGSNCSAGQAAGGVTAAGVAEDCTDYWTEAENTAANYEQALTAGDGLTRTVDDFDCDTASGSVFGCLSTTDWSTFNTKLGAYDAWTHPASAQSATTSLLFMAGLVSTASSTINGSLNILGNATATNATTTTFYNSGQTRLGALGSSLVLSGSTGILSNYAGIGCTNQVVEDVSAAGTGTCVSINNGYWSGTDLSVANGGTGLSTFGGTNTVLYTTAADTLSSEAAFTYNPSTDTITVVNGSLTNGTSTNYEVTGTASSTAVVVGKTIRLFGTVYSTLAALGNALVNAVTAVTPTGTWDFGGATSVEMVNGTAPTVDAIGEFALDTTARQLLIATSTNASYPAVLPLEQPLFSITIGSTTPEFISSGTIPISRWVGKGREITRVECFVSGGTSKVMNVSDGTNDTETTTCGTTNTQDNSLDTNATFTASELWYIEFGATTGTVNYVTYTAYGYIDRE